MNVALWIVQALLAALFVLSGVMKAFQYERAKASWSWVKDVPRGLVTFIGICELLGAFGLLLPMLTGVLPWLTPVAAVGLAIIMVLGSAFHATRAEYRAIPFNIVVLVLIVFVAYGRFALVPA